MFSSILCTVLEHIFYRQQWSSSSFLQQQRWYLQTFVCCWPGRKYLTVFYKYYLLVHLFALHPAEEDSPGSGLQSWQWLIPAQISAQWQHCLGVNKSDVEIIFVAIKSEIILFTCLWLRGHCWSAAPWFWKYLWDEEYQRDFDLWALMEQSEEFQPQFLRQTEFFLEQSPPQTRIHHSLESGDPSAPCLRVSEACNLSWRSWGQGWCCCGWTWCAAPPGGEWWVCLFSKEKYFSCE